jgi:ABC-type Fe3+-hydroxamate transport system substrate-binding protein
VPSLTEALAAADPGAIVAATQWCTFPADLDVPRIRGTKNPDCRAIIAMRPDLVIANQEENREIDVRRLRDAGIAVWVTRIRSVEEAHSSIARMFAQALAWPVPGWLRQSEQVWMTPPSLGDLTAAAVIWRDPWMVVGSQTFAGDVLSRLGISNPYATHAERYPVVDVEVLDAMGLEAILLPDEPYPFTLSDGPDALPRTPTALIDGRMLTWYGPSLLEARDHLETSIRAVMRG